MVSVLSACANLVVAKEGELIHGLITKNGLETYVNLFNALINMYSSWGNIDAPRLLFYYLIWPSWVITQTKYLGIL